MATQRTQNEKILTHLEKGKSVTAALARSRWGVQNLRARIHELREEGFEIVTEEVTRGGKRTFRYVLN